MPPIAIYLQKRGHRPHKWTFQTVPLLGEEEEET